MKYPFPIIMKAKLKYDLNLAIEHSLYIVAFYVSTSLPWIKTVWDWY